MLTGLGNEQVAAEAMRAGAQDYLVKDRITAESLRLAIEKATGKVGLLRALQSERDDLVIIQITANNTRTVTQKQAFYARVATLLAESPGLRSEDVFINLVEVAKENWSFGNGEAQYV